MKENLLQIFNTYGKSHQIGKLLEEVGELIETIINEDKENIVQEFADVCVVLEQFKAYYNLDNDKIINMMKFKIQRQLDRINNENK